MLSDSDEILISLLSAYLDHELEEDKKQEVKDRLQQDERARKLLLLLLRVRQGIEAYGILQDTPQQGQETEQLKEQLKEIHQQQVLDFNPKKWLKWVVGAVIVSLVAIGIYVRNKTVNPTTVSTPPADSLRLQTEPTPSPSASADSFSITPAPPADTLNRPAPTPEKPQKATRSKKTTAPKSPTPEKTPPQPTTTPTEQKRGLTYKNTAGNVEFKDITDTENIFFTYYQKQLYAVYHEKFYSLPETNEQFVEAQEETNEQIKVYLLAQNKFTPYKKKITNAPLPATKYPRVIEALVLVNNNHKTYDRHYRIGVRGIELYGNFKKKEVRLIEANPEQFYLVIGNDIYQIQHSFDVLPLPDEVSKEERRKIKKWLDEQP